MAIRIVKDEPDESVIKRKVCGNCGVTLEYVPQDIETATGKDYDGGGWEQTFIKCPKCSEKVILTSY